MPDDATFKLTSHEVMRGLKLRDGRLVFRTSGGVILWAVAQAAFAMVFATIILSSTVAWLGFAVGAVPAIVLLARIRCRVEASQDGVVIRNRWRSHTVSLDAAPEARVMVEDRVLTPVPTFQLTWQPHPCEVGYLGRRGDWSLKIDALIGVPERDSAVDPSAVQMKVAALNRYLDSVR